MKQPSWKNFGLILTLFGLMIGWQNLSATKTYHQKSKDTLNRYLAEAKHRNPTDTAGISLTKKSDIQPSRAYRYLTDSLVNYALTLKGTSYVYGGISKSGFDCSGFTTFIYNKFGITIPRSSALQANAGTAIDRKKARPGDLIIFTGTNPSIRKPGHVGIVISRPGEVITFVHSSSNGGVKTSQVEGTRYERRFLEIRRVL